MRRFFLLLSLLVIPAATWAQGTPKVEVFAGYSNLYANFSNPSFDMNGVNLSVQENLNSWFGGAVDFSTHFGTENGLKTNTQTLSYGPVFSYRKNRILVPFTHASAGVERGGENYLDISQPEIRFAVLAGGGLDVNVTPRIALRLIQADYLLTRFSSARQDNLRLSAGIVFLLGQGKR